MPQYSSTYEYEQSQNNQSDKDDFWKNLSTEEQLMYQTMIQYMDQAGYSMSIDSTGSVTLNKKEDVRVQQAIDQYGADSSEVAAIRTELSEQEATRKYQEDEIANAYNQKVIDILSGKMELTVSQDEFIKKEQQRRNDIALQGLNGILGEIDRTGQSVSSELNNYRDLILSGQVSENKALDVVGNLINQRGMDVKSALQLVNTRIEEKNTTVGAELEKSFSQARQLAKVGLQDQADKMQADVSNQAALLGRNPTDPIFQRSFMEATQKNIQEVELALGVSEADRRAALASATGDEKIQLQRQFADLEERLGLAREGVAQQRFGVEQQTQLGLQDTQRMRTALAEQLGGKREAAQAGYAGELSGIGKDIYNTRLGIATGMPFQQMQAGGTAQELSQSLYNQQLANLGSIFGAAGTPYSYQQSLEQIQEQKKKDLWDIIGMLFGAAGTAANVYDASKNPPTGSPGSTSATTTAAASVPV